MTLECFLLEYWIIYPALSLSLYVVWFTSALEYVLSFGRSRISGNTYSIFEMKPNCRCRRRAADAPAPIHLVSSLLEVKRKICANNMKWRALKYSWVDLLLQCYRKWEGAYTQGACDTCQTVCTKCTCEGEFNGCISGLHGGWKKMRMDKSDI